MIGFQNKLCDVAITRSSTVSRIRSFTGYSSKAAVTFDIHTRILCTYRTSGQ